MSFFRIYHPTLLYAAYQLSQHFLFIFSQLSPYILDYNNLPEILTIPSAMPPVQVVIPETDIDRSVYRYVASDEQEDWPKDPSLVTLRNQSRFGKRDERSAMAGKARKDLVAGKEIQMIDLDSEHEDESGSRRGQLMPEMVLVD